GVLDLLRAETAHVRDRPLDRTHHLRHRDLLGRPREPVAALDASLAADDARVPEVAEDVLEELERNLLRLRDPLALDRPVRRRRARCRRMARRPPRQGPPAPPPPCPLPPRALPALPAPPGPPLPPGRVRRGAADRP